jgi:hypothetical protein
VAVDAGPEIFWGYPEHPELPGPESTDLPAMLFRPPLDGSDLQVELLICDIDWPSGRAAERDALRYELSRRYVVPPGALTRPHRGTSAVQLVAATRMRLPRDDRPAPQAQLRWCVRWTAGGRRHQFETALRIDLRPREAGRMSNFVWRPEAEAAAALDGLIVAVDLGTTATTVTAYLRTQGTLGQRNIWEPQQIKVLVKRLEKLLRPAPNLPEHEGMPSSVRLEAAHGRLARLLDQLLDAHVEDHAIVDDRVSDALELVLTDVERLLHRATQDDPAATAMAWRAWHEMFEAAYQIPPLFRSGLEPVALARDPNSRLVPSHHATPVSSRLHILEGTTDAGALPDPRSPWPTYPLGAQLQAEDTRFSVQSPINQQLVLRDLKRMYTDVKRLTAPLPSALQPSDPLTPRLTGGDLVTGAIAWITARAERYAAARSGADVTRMRRVTWLTVTYPTSMSPRARRILRQTLRNGLNIKQIDMRVDEAVAAALYHVYQSATNPDWGLDGLRASSRRVRNGLGPGYPDQANKWWRQNTLVIDVGGGTTDIALIATYLSDRGGPDDPAASRGAQARATATSHDSQVPAETSGHRFSLIPQVLASSGHSRLGGDLLTLKVFYWIKAILVDRALGLADASEQPAATTLQAQVDALRIAENGTYAPLLRGGLADGLLSQSDEGPAKPAMAYVLSQLVPTGWEGAGANQRVAFEVLWEIAERAKKTLGQGLPFPLPTALVTDMYQDTAEVSALRELLPTLSAVDQLRPQEFLRLATPMFDKVVAMGIGVSHRALTADGSAEPIDRIVLSGRSCGMPLVEDIVRRHVADYVRRNGANVVPDVFVERHMPKQSTSIGACWATQMHQHQLHKGDTRQLRQGEDVIDFDVAGLVMSAPSDFLLTGNADAAIEVIRIGQRFDYTTENGESSARSTETLHVQSLIEIQRAMGGDHTVSWGRVHFASLAQEHGIITDASADGYDGPAIKFRVELLQDLTIRLHFFLGREIHLLPEHPAGVIQPPGPRHGAPLRLRILGDPDAALPGRSASLDVSLQSCPHLVVMDRQGHEDPKAARPARVWDRPLPRPFHDREQQRAYWRCQWHYAEGYDEAVLEISGLEGRESPHFATFLETGTVVLTTVYPAHLPAVSLKEVVAQPGRVFVTLLDDDEPFSHAEWAPLTGRH